MSIQNNNILVTGAYGFIASQYVQELIKYEYNVTVLDMLTYAGDKRRLNNIKHKSYIGDICDKKLVNDIVDKENIDTIVNFAAESMVDRSIEDGYQFVHTNVVGVYTLLDIMRKKDLNKMVQISTDECYGSILEGSFSETDKLNPGNPYSATKSGADLLCLSFENTYNIPVTITRSSNNYGPFQDTEKFIPRMISLAMQGKDLEIYGNGQNIRDWLHVKDNCHAIRLVMRRGSSGEIYNIGGGKELTNIDIAKIIADRFGVGIKYISDRLGHDFRYSINCDKIRRELGWSPKISFENGIEDTIKWYVEEDKKNLLLRLMGK